MTLANGPLQPTGVIAFVQPGDARLLVGGKPACDLSVLLEAFGCLKDTCYIGPFRNALNIGTKTDYYDIQVGQSFISAWKQFKSGSSGASNEAAYRVERDIQRIFDLKDLQINPGPEDQTLQLFIDGRSFKLGEVGAGLTQFILVLANCAMTKRRFILLDEPEISLHPSLQLDFLTTLASYAPSGGVIFATHNLGLARASAQWIYAARKESGLASRLQLLESMPRLSEFLGELSFGGYRELGFESVLLVEGPTDVVAVQQLLRRYSSDHKIVLMHMGGSAMINGSRATEVQLQELKRITDKVSALIDSERDSPEAPAPADRHAFVRLCAAAEVKCHLLERRAIENYWTDRAIQNVKGPSFQAIGHYARLRETSNPWSKHENWLIAREMELDELAQTDLGEFLRDL